jgi:dTDP-4-dehydrorhamnose 3,5-epimerase
MGDVLFTPLRKIPTQGGNVLHAMKAVDPGYEGFGEAYFSTIDGGAIKGWRRHNRATLNFIVPVGEVQIRIFEASTNIYEDFIIGPSDENNYGRLTIPPGKWVAFGGLAPGDNILLNIMNIGHDPSEADTRQIDELQWKWAKIF